MTARAGWGTNSGVFPDPRFRSPTTVAEARRVVPFVRGVEVKTGDHAFVDLTPQNFQPFGSNCAIQAIAGLVDDVAPGQLLKIWLQPELVFECDLLLLSLQRLNHFTKIEPGILVGGGRGVLRIEADKPMMVWLKGAYTA